MDTEDSFRRVLLKVSGEALRGGDDCLDAAAVHRLAEQLKQLVTTGTQTSLVLGGGNLFRGLGASEDGMERNIADHIGMLATVMNALAVKEILLRLDVVSHVLTPFGIPGVTSTFDHALADAELNAGEVVIFAGGTGHPFFTTDTAAALRACEIRADAVLKATKVDGVFTADPHVDAGAKRYRTLSYEDALHGRLGVMDSTAFSLCRDNRIPIVVFNFFQENGVARVVRGDRSTATYVGACDTRLAELAESC